VPALGRETRERARLLLGQDAAPEGAGRAVQEVDADDADAGPLAGQDRPGQLRVDRRLDLALAAGDRAGREGEVVQVDDCAGLAAAVIRGRPHRGRQGQHLPVAARVEVHQLTLDVDV